MSALVHFVQSTLNLSETKTVSSIKEESWSHKNKRLISNISNLKLRFYFFVDAVIKIDLNLCAIHKKRVSETMLLKLGKIVANENFFKCRCLLFPVVYSK